MDTWLRKVIVRAIIIKITVAIISSFVQVTGQSHNECKLKIRLGITYRIMTLNTCSAR